MDNGYREYTDNELAALLKGGNEAAYAEIYDRYWTKLYLYARKMLQDDEQAMDIVQDLFTALWHNRRETCITTSLKTYIYTAVRNLTLNYISRSKLKSTYLESIAAFSETGIWHTEEHVLSRELADRIDRQIEHFPVRMKQIFVLSRSHGLSNKAIASELSITDHAVKKAINRALKVLKTVLS